MRISTKGRYALAAVIEIARSAAKGENVAVVNVASKLGISKLYLEQVFSQLRNGEVLQSEKGARGGYQLLRSPQNISAWDVLSTVETALMEPVGKSVEENAPDIAAAMNTLVFDSLNTAVRGALSQISIQQLLDHAECLRGEQALMYYL
jgi:Rrf2 family protein